MRPTCIAIAIEGIMRAISVLVWALASLLPAPAARAQAVSSSAGRERLSALIAGRLDAGEAGPALGLDEVERIALDENPEIHVAVRHVASTESHLPAAGTL